MHELGSRLMVALGWSAAFFATVAGAVRGQAAMTTQISEDFTTDSRWEGRNNVPPSAAGAAKTQDFGYSRTGHAGGQPGEIGGRVSRALRLASYANVAQ